MTEEQKEYGKTSLMDFIPFQGENDALDKTEVFLNDRALQQVKTAYTTAVAVQKPRSIEAVSKNVLAESRLAGSSFYYRWKVKSKRTGRESTVQGPSIDLAMCIARNYGNCVVDIEGTETKTHYMLRGVFIDLETGFTVPRLYRQRKSQNVGSGYGDERSEDMVFQIAQSKAQRNAIVKAMPAWLIDKAIEVARQAEIGQIKPENMVLARASVLEFFAGYGVTPERIEEKLERKVEMWTAEDIVDLRASATALKEGRISAGELFPGENGAQSEETEDLETRILNGKHGHQMSEVDKDIGNPRDKYNPLTEPVQKKYSEGKKAAVMKELENRAIEFNPAWTGAHLHQMLLDDVPTKGLGGSDVGDEYRARLDEANEIFLRRKETSPELWESACKNAKIANPNLGLADLDEADKFDACFLEIIENGS